MKWFVMIAIAVHFLSETKAQAFDLAQIKVEQMKKVFNRRDFDLLLIDLQKADVQHAACQIQKKQNQLPRACFEARPLFQRLEISLRDLEVTNCDFQFEQMKPEDLQALVKWHRADGFSSCGVEWLEKLRLWHYKKVGKKIEIKERYEKNTLTQPDRI